MSPIGPIRALLLLLLPTAAVAANGLKLPTTTSQARIEYIRRGRVREPTEVSAKQLEQLPDAQIADLFRAARIERLQRTMSDGSSGRREVSVKDWAGPLDAATLTTPTVRGYLASATGEALILTE